MKSFIHGILPSMLLSMAVGQIYAFTNFAGEISQKIDAPLAVVQIAFSLGIFFLGMGAAFFGKFVEKDIKGATFLGTFLFIAGLLCSQAAVSCKSLALLYVGYGCLLGLGTGTIYITPVKTMMMWLPKHKAVASAVPIVFFGLGSTLSSLLFPLFMKTGIGKVFIYYAVLYLAMMIAASFLLKKPENYDISTAKGSSDFKYSNILKDGFFIKAWLFMFLNISAGLSLIPLSRQLMQSDRIAYSSAAIGTYIALAGIFNGAGRLIFAWTADRLKTRLNIILPILGDSILAIFLCLFLPKAFGISLLIINACYGAGFSVIPSILSDKFGMNDISKIHGAVLSAWGIAGLIGNNMSIAVNSKFGWTGVFIMLIVMYGLNLINWLSMRTQKAAL
ncbi:MAG: MFS transporter [Victivallales bacterium]|nr:MFS transporter [Victivallales bacterium]